MTVVPPRIVAWAGRPMEEMLPPARDRESLVKAARMYFLDGRSQDDIARVLGTGRSNVSRMLAAAREQRIVEIRVHGRAGRDLELEEALRLRFDLEPVRVAAFSTDANVISDVGELAAEWLDETLKDDQVVGLSWGKTLQAMVDALSVDRPRAVEVVPLLGGLSSTASLASGEELVRAMAGKLGGSYRYLHAPALLRSHAAQQALLAEPAVASSLEHALSADVALVGLGALGVGSSAQVLEGLHLTWAQHRALLDAGAVGDVCCRFYNADGQPVASVAQDRVLAVTLGGLKRIPTVVGVAAGREKAVGVLGALRGRIVTGLITDASLAHAILASASGPDGPSQTATTAHA
jgi:DNA-binding transcriptional regulator LsrR (DeoR family)